MSPMFRELYEELTFNNLYNFLKNVTESNTDFYSESDKARAKQIIEKLNNYSRIELDDDGCEWIKVNWFGEEVRDILYLILFSFNFKPSSENKNWFQEMKLIYEKTSDPIYQQKLKLQHFSSNVFSLSNEDETLMRKARNIMKFLSIPTNKLLLGCTDFPSRCWQVYRDYKTKEDVFDFYETKDGWEIIETYKCKKEDVIKITKYIINIETIEKSSEIETKHFFEEE